MKTTDHQPCWQLKMHPIFFVFLKINPILIHISLKQNHLSQVGNAVETKDRGHKGPMLPRG